MMEHGRNTMFLVYVIICVLIIDVFSFRIECYMKDSLVEYQDTLLTNINSIINEYFDIQKLCVNSFLSSHIEETSIEDYTNNEEGLIRELRDFKEFDTEIDYAFVYYDNENRFVCAPENLESVNQIYNDLFKKLHTMNKRAGAIKVIGMIGDSLVISNPLYSRDDNYVASFISVIPAERINAIHGMYANENLIGSIKVIQFGNILYQSPGAEKAGRPILVKNADNERSQLTVRSEITYDQVVAISQGYYYLKAIAKIILCIFFIIIVAYLVKRKRLGNFSATKEEIYQKVLKDYDDKESIKKIRKFEEYNNIFLVISIVVQIVFIICLGNSYLKFKEEMINSKITNILEYTEKLEEINTNYGKMSFQKATKEIAANISKYPPNEVKDVLFNKYRTYVGKMLKSNEFVSCMFLMLKDSSCVYMPEVNLDISYAELFNNTIPITDKAFAVTLKELDDRHRYLIIAPLIYRGEEIGVIGYMRTIEYMKRKMINSLSIEDAKSYYIQENKTYEINDFGFNSKDFDYDEKIKSITQKITKDKFVIDNKKDTYFVYNLQSIGMYTITRPDMISAKVKIIVAMISLIILIILFTASLIVFTPTFLIEREEIKNIEKKNRSIFLRRKLF